MLQINTISKLDIGVKDENNARDLYIDCNAWLTDFPNGSFSIWHKRNGDETKYAASGVSFDRETGILKWTPDAYDTFYVGKGMAEIRLTENNVIKKTKDIITECERSLVLGSGETLAAGWQNFLNAVDQAKSDAEDAAEDAEDAAEAAEEARDAAEAAVAHNPIISELTGTWLIWDPEEEEYVDTELPSRGPQGETGQTGPAGRDGSDGADGSDGVSPVVSSEAITGGHRITIVDAEGTTTVDVMDGADGQTGPAGQDGSDGVSPTVSSESITGGHRITIVDAGGTTTMDVMDGEDGQTGPAGQDGVSPTISSTAVAYQNSQSGTTVPTGTWETVQPSTPQGYYLWIRYTLTWSTGGTTVMYTISRMGIDGSGSVVAVKVNGTTYNPDADGIVDLGTITVDVSGKADKVSGATSGNFAGLDGNGNLTDSGHKHSDYLTSHQDISGKADKVSGATNGNFAGLDSNGNLTDSGHKHSDYLTSHQDISGKADKVSGATSGNFAGMDSNGNLTDSGHKHSDYLTSHQDISGKADKVSGATSGNFAGLDGNGNLSDSGHKHSDYASAAKLDDFESGMAIVVNGNTAPKNITKGQYLFIKNHSTLATGGYHAKSNISSGASITNSNVSADADGLINAVGSVLANNEIITYETITYTNEPIIDAGSGGYYSPYKELTVPPGYTPVSAVWSNDFVTCVIPFVYYNNGWNIALNAPKYIAKVNGTVNVMYIKNTLS